MLHNEDYHHEINHQLLQVASVGLQGARHLSDAHPSWSSSCWRSNRCVAGKFQGVWLLPWNQCHQWLVGGDRSVLDPSSCWCPHDRVSSSGLCWRTRSSPPSTRTPYGDQKFSTKHFGPGYVDHQRQHPIYVSNPLGRKNDFYKQAEGKLLDAKDIHAGYDQLNKLFSQGGEIVIFYDKDLPKSQTLQNVSLASWKSYRLKRRTVNTLSSETQALVRGLSSVHWYRVLILEARGLHLSAREWHREVAQLPFMYVTDSKSLYDTICKCTNPASQCEDKRTSIDISLIKQEIAELNGTIRWIDGRTMLADSRTKESKADLLRHVMKTGHWSILEEGSALQRKLLERTSRHEVLFIF